MRNELIGFVFQSFQLLHGLTALENVMLPLELRGDKHAKAAAVALLHRVGLSYRLSHTPKQLSGGEQQRVALARAFVTKPAIFLPMSRPVIWIVKPVRRLLIYFSSLILKTLPP